MFFFVCSVPLFYLQRSSFLFAAFLFLYLQRFPFLFAALLFCLQRFFFVCSVPFLFAAFLFCLQRFFFLCSVSFFFAAFLFCLQRFFFLCSVSRVGHRRLSMFMKHNTAVFHFRRSVYWDNNLAKDWDNIEPTKTGNLF